MELLSHSSTFLLPSVSTDQSSSLTYALVVLNQKLPRFIPLLWNHTRLRMCADGGDNRLYDEMPLLFPHENVFAVRRRYKPDVIKGDMDPVRTDVLNYYKNMGAEILDESQEQDTTDLHKCIAHVLHSFANIKKFNLCILVSGALGGRFDHEMGNINVLCHLPSLRSYSNWDAILKYYNYWSPMELK